MAVINSPILRFVYSSKEEAINKAKELGSDGFREYNINGTLCYVPCFTFAEYEKVTRTVITKGGNLASGNDTFGGGLVGMQFANNNEFGGDPFLTLGNFSIVKDISVIQTSVSGETNAPVSYTQESISNTLGVQPNNLSNYVEDKLKPKFNVDTSNVSRFVLFSSLKERIKNGLVEIITNFPAAIKIEYLGQNIRNVVSYIENRNNNTSTITINSNAIRNPFGIEYNTTGTTLNDYDDRAIIRNFSKYYTNYTVFFNDQEYDIIDVVLRTSGTNLSVTVNGFPFADVKDNDNNVNTKFYLKPNKTIVNKFYEGLSDVAKFLLNFDNQNKLYATKINVPVSDDTGKSVIQPVVLYFPLYDDYNLDVFTTKYDEYVLELNSIAESFDSFKSDLISRTLTTEAFKEFDTVDRKMENVLQLYGRGFDAVKVYVDSLAYMRNVSYDKIDNVPDLLIKNFAQTLGWDTNRLDDDDAIVTSLFTISQPLEDTITPQEFDIEVWRRLLLNTAYLFKSKGTRKAIEALLEIVGIPDYIIDINEYIYLTEAKLDANNKYLEIAEALGEDDPANLVGLYPFDSEGYPSAPTDVAYQEAGGYIVIDKENIGPYDNGKTYLDKFRDFDGIKGFELIKTIDNKKSWVYTESATINEDTDSDTSYEVIDSRLLINTKEVEIYLNSQRVVDFLIYRYFKRNRLIIDTNYGISYTNGVNPTNITFSQFIKDCLNNFIDPRNRKTVIVYPTLRKLYYDFKKSYGKDISNSVGIDFINQFDTYWVQLIKQVIPATTIFNAGKKVKNSDLLDNKYKYKAGIDKGSEFTNETLKRVNQGTNSIEINGGKIYDTAKALSTPLSIYNQLKESNKGIDNSLNLYRGKYYSIKDECERDGKYYLYDNLTDYTESDFGGNINTLVVATGLTSESVGGRYGVFVVARGNLYRLRTVNNYDENNNLLTPNDTELNTTSQITIINVLYNRPGGTVTLYKKYNGITGVTVDYDRPAFDIVPKNVNSHTITFADCPNPTNIEREFFINSISKALAYIELGFNFDCPPPKAHTCYFDIAGSIIDLEPGSYTSSDTQYTIPDVAYYTDNTNTDRVIKQPYYYGYSTYTGTTKPLDGEYLRDNNWLVPYRRSKTWSNGITYYKGDVVSYSGNFYEITATTAVGSVSTPTGSTLTPYRNGLAYKYSKRVKTDPLMHIDYAYINKINLNPMNDTLSINLSKLIDTYQIFSGLTIDTTYKVDDIYVGDKLFIDNKLIAEFDGLYPVNSDNIGPFYNLNDTSLIHTLTDELDLVPNIDNFISITSINEGFADTLEDVSLVKSNNPYYLIKDIGFYKFDINLYFDADLTRNNRQSVIIKLVDQNGLIYNQQEFTFIGSSLADDRIYNFVYEGFFRQNDRVYIAIQPLDFPCKLKRFEEIDYTHSEVPYGQYNPINDGRFRLLFNAGRLINGNSIFEKILSIQPLLGKEDIVSQTTINIADKDVYKIATQGQSQSYFDIVKPKVVGNTDPDLLFNKLYSDYYKKYRDTDDILNISSLVYDKTINYDKVDFTFKAKTRKLPIERKEDNDDLAGEYGITVTKDITLTDWYLGNTPTAYEFASPSFNISIGKKQIKRDSVYSKTIPYAPNRSHINGSKSPISTGSTGSIDIDGTSFGIEGYDKYDFNKPFETEFKDKNYTVNDLTYLLENPIYSSEEYLQLLEFAEEFNPKIINYQLNDIVKYKINSYKKPVLTSTGYTIETVDIYRLFVCIEETTIFHCDLNDILPKNIRNIYHPNAGHSCFVEITEYDPKLFTPWGYEKWRYKDITYSNIEPYTYGPITTYTGSSTDFTQFNYGDIVTDGTRVYRYIYNKPINYISGGTVTYLAGDFVQYKTGTTYSFYVCKSVTGTTTAPGTANWQHIDPFSPTLITFTNAFFDKNSKICRLQNLVPRNGFTVTNAYTTGYTDVYRNEMLIYPMELSGTSYGDIPNLYSIDNGTTNIGARISTTTFSNYPVYNANTSGLTVVPSYLGANSYPLFEELCNISLINNPRQFSTGTTYNAFEKTLSYKYAVSHGKVWRFKGSQTTGTTLTVNEAPSVNAEYWTDSDFCVADKFKFYKDRVSVKVYNSTVESLDETTKDNLYFFNSNLEYKNGFSINQFTGSTLDTKHLNALELYADSIDENIKSVTKYGNFATRYSNGDLFLDYQIEKDNLGLPVTGEFVGKLNLKDVCGNSATTIFGLLLDTDVNKLRDMQVRYIAYNTDVTNTNGFNYFVRVITNYTSDDPMIINYTGLTTGILTVDRSNNLDRNLLTNKNGEIVLEFKYVIGKGKTLVKSVLLNSVNIDQLSNVTSSTSVSGNIETRVIKISKVVGNFTLNFITDTFNDLNIGNTNINTTINL